MTRNGNAHLIVSTVASRSARPFRLLAALAIASAALMAQTGGGATLVGTVTDSSGAFVAGAKVTVLNTGTSFVTETTTNAEGAYYVPYLIPGDYRVTAAAAGFKEFVRGGLTLHSAEVPRIDIKLEVGALKLEQFVKEPKSSQDFFVRAMRREMFPKQLLS